MDFMDDDMKEIANKAYIACGDEHDECVYAACEAVLAEQKRQKQAWDGYPPLEEAPKQMDAVRQQPAEDVVQRMRDAVTGMRGMAAALAVAREGMYSLEQVEQAMRAELEQRDHSWSNTLFLEHVVARLCLTAKQQPTEQEPAKWVNISYRVDVMGSTCVVCGAVISDQLAHTEWHNNQVTALGKGGK